MALTVLELNDAGILAGRDGQILLESPGFAVIDGKRIVTGIDAFRSARLHPRSTATRFWDRLGLEPVDQAGYGNRTYADLAFDHLKSIWTDLAAGSDRVILAVPGSFSREQLSLLLGMAREADVPVRGIVDAAVAAASRALSTPRSLVLDIQLHRVVLTELSAGTRLGRQTVHENGRFGLVAFRDAWADRIADTFVRATRFDPMHDAGTEQALHDALSGYASQLVDGAEAVVELAAGGRTHTATIKRDTLVEAVKDELAQIGQLVAASTRPGETVSLLLTARAKAIPGLNETLRRIPELNCVMLPRDAALIAAAHQVEHIVSNTDALEFVTSLPLGRSDLPVDAPPGDAPPPAAEPPTHVLYRARAYRIDTTPLVVGTRTADSDRSIPIAGFAEGVSRRHLSIVLGDNGIVAEDHSTYGTFLNGRRIDGNATLAVGDRLRIGSPGGEELQLIVAVS